jgi:hypothetical protein
MTTDTITDFLNMVRLPAATVSVCDPTWQLLHVSNQEVFPRPVPVSRMASGQCAELQLSPTFSIAKLLGVGAIARDEPEGQEHEHAEREVDCGEDPREPGVNFPERGSNRSPLPSPLKPRQSSRPLSLRVGGSRFPPGIPLGRPVDCSRWPTISERSLRKGVPRGRRARVK